MKILLVHNHYQYRGGEDSVFDAEVELLRQHGHAVETLTFSNDAIRSPWDKLKAGILSIHNPLSAKLFREKIKIFRPDLVHIHNFFPIASPAILQEAKRHSVPVVMTLHNFRLICPNALLYRNGKVCESCVGKIFPIDGIIHGCYRDSRMQSASLAAMTATHNVMGTWRKAVQCYVALNSFARGKILDSALGLRPEQVTVKPNFTFDPFGADETPIPAHQRDDYFVFAGRLSQEKAIDTLLAAFIQSGQRLKIVGTGPMEAQVLAAAAECDRIEVLGFQSRSEVQSLLKSAKALVLPSIWYENFPMTILEAFSCGTPVITSRIGGLPDIVKEGETGFLAEPGSVESLVTQVNRLAMEPAYDVLCRNARETYLQQYTPAVNYRLLMDIYLEAIHDYPAREKKYSEG